MAVFLTSPFRRDPLASQRNYAPCTRERRGYSAWLATSKPYQKAFSSDTIRKFRTRKQYSTPNRFGTICVCPTCKVGCLKSNGERKKERTAAKRKTESLVEQRQTAPCPSGQSAVCFFWGAYAEDGLPGNHPTGKALFAVRPELSPHAEDTQQGAPTAHKESFLSGSCAAQYECFPGTVLKQKKRTANTVRLAFWRSGRDSNPRPPA